MVISLLLLLLPPPSLPPPPLLPPPLLPEEVQGIVRGIFRREDLPWTQKTAISHSHTLKWSADTHLHTHTSSKQASVCALTGTHVRSIIKANMKRAASRPQGMEVM